MKNYKVYVIRDKANAIKYAGLTSQSLSKRFWQHCFKKKLDSKEYRIELIQEYLTLIQAVKLEEMLINQYFLRETGWNVAAESINGYSNRHPQWLRDKWSNERPGKPVSKEHAAKNRIARLGKTNSAEHNARIGETHRKAVMCIETGEIFDSARKAAKKLGLQYSKISLVCNGLRSMTGGYHFCFVKKR